MDKIGVQHVCPRPVTAVSRASAFPSRLCDHLLPCKKIPASLKHGLCQIHVQYGFQQGYT